MAVALWTDPNDWAVGEALTALKMQNYVSNNELYLFSRPKDVVTVNGDGTDITVVGPTSMTEVNDAIFTLELDTNGGDVRIWSSIPWAGNGTARFIGFDILIDDTNYASSGSPTPAANGVWTKRYATANYADVANLDVLVEGLAAGVHTFKLRCIANSNDVIVYLSSYFMQFGAREV